jgi:hypothetical protein
MMRSWYSLWGNHLTLETDSSEDDQKVLSIDGKEEEQKEVPVGTSDAFPSVLPLRRTDTFSEQLNGSNGQAYSMEDSLQAFTEVRDK